MRVISRIIFLSQNLLSFGLILLDACVVFSLDWLFQSHFQLIFNIECLHYPSLSAKRCSYSSYIKVPNEVLFNCVLFQWVISHYHPRNVHHIISHPFLHNQISEGQPRHFSSSPKHPIYHKILLFLPKNYLSSTFFSISCHFDLIDGTSFLTDLFSSTPNSSNPFSVLQLEWCFSKAIVIIMFSVQTPFD